MYLQRIGYTILERSWECAHGIIDFICKDGGILVFAGMMVGLGDFPSFTSTSEQRLQYRRLAMSYLAERDIADMPLRFDKNSMTALQQNIHLMMKPF